MVIASKHLVPYSKIIYQLQQNNDSPECKGKVAPAPTALWLHAHYTLVLDKNLKL
jgi:hypothetical protein